jgi:tRNA(Arg) A34 adenosine deaminase TadA
MGAIISSRIKNIYIGTLDPKKEKEEAKKVLEDYEKKYGINVKIGILQEKCEYILKDFFKNLRKNGGEK